MSDAKLTKEAWRERLEPAFVHSMQAVREALTNEAHIQSWIRSASYKAAMGLQDPTDMQAKMQAYGQLLDDLETQFAPLVEAVRELTEGCGTLDINWRPLSPNFTTLLINFGTSYPVDVFCRLRAASPDEARRALERVAGALPKSEPFPRRPNKATGLAALDGQCLGIRLQAHYPGDDAPRRRVTLLPSGQKPVTDLSPDEAPARIVKLLTPSEGQHISPDAWIDS